jgi:hypothetical protein
LLQPCNGLVPRHLQQVEEAEDEVELLHHLHNSFALLLVASVMKMKIMSRHHRTLTVLVAHVQDQVA